MKTPLSIIGAGDVGQELLRQITAKDEQLLPISITNSRGTLYDKNGILPHLSLKKNISDQIVAHEQFLPQQNFRRFVERLLWNEGVMDELIVVDVSSADDALETHQELVSRAIAVVTANKNPLAQGSNQDFEWLRTGEYVYGATVMAGNGALDQLKALRDAKEIPVRVQALLSGTLGYLCTEMEKGRPFSQVLIEAYEEGYTESDPRTDLSGLDVAKKLVIMARTLGIQTDLAQVKREPFIPFDAEEKKEEFLERLEQYDRPMAEAFQASLSRGKTRRFVAEADLTDPKHPVFQACLKEVEQDSPLDLKGTNNILSLQTKTAYPEGKMFQIIAPGAGPEVTALSVRMDIMKVAERR